MPLSVASTCPKLLKKKKKKSSVTSIIIIIIIIIILLDFPFQVQISTIAKTTLTQ